MKNLKPYKGDCFKIHEKAVNKKHKGELKDRLQGLNETVKKEFDNYADKFKTNEINLLTPNELLNTSKEDLLTLYDYQNATITSLRENIKDLQIKTITNTCQNCTIDSAKTLDHILPKSIFPEFIVNPINLFPCCTTCNSYKLTTVENDGGKFYLNLYLDKLPEEQYLFVDVFLDEHNEINFRFFLENIDRKIDSKLFSAIENHYTKLHLFERMASKSIEYISEFENEILKFKHLLSLETIIEESIKAANSNKEAYGSNHWKCILEISLLDSPIFMDKFR